MRMNLVTISMLPGVRKVDRHAENLSADDRRVIDVIYAELHNSISLSEIYIVPSDFDPHKVDAKTGKPQEPIFMFDGKNLGAGDSVIAEAQAAEKVKPEEYGLLKARQAWLCKRFFIAPSHGSVDPPMISGREIIARDSKEFKKTRDDNDQKGSIFSVPFYGEDGKYQGMISAVARTNVLCRQLTFASQDVAANIHQMRVSSADNQQAAAGVFGNSNIIAAEVSQVSKDVAAFIEKIRAA